MDWLDRWLDRWVKEGRVEGFIYTNSMQGGHLEDALASFRWWFSTKALLSGTPPTRRRGCRGCYRLLKYRGDCHLEGELRGGVGGC